MPLTAVLVLAVNDPLRSGSGTEPTPSATAPAPTAALPPLPVAPPPALTPAAQRSCQELISALPARLGERAARPVDSPSPYVSAWGDPPVVLRCGVPRPPAFRADSEVLDINGVRWFAEPHGRTTTFTAMDRAVYVEVVSPTAEASAPAARLSTAISRALARRPGR